MLSVEAVKKIAQKFNDMGGNPIKLETLIADADLEIWTTPRHKLTEALEFHGITIKNGEVRKLDLTKFRETVKTGFDEFMIAMQGVSRILAEPASLETIISMSGIGASAVPGIGVNHYLAKAGMYYIEGVGYWLHKQYANDTGQIWSMNNRRGKSSVLIDALKKYGWPLCGLEVDKVSHGEVTSQFLAKMAQNKDSGIVRSIGKGLYVPIGAVSKHPFPISMKVANYVVQSTARQLVITNTESPLLFKIASPLAKAGYVVLKEKTAQRNGRRQRAIQLELTAHGHKMLAGSGKALKDEF